MIIADFSGQTLGGRYRLVARIGHGGMATVYEAVDTQIDKPVAVKVLHPQFAVADDYMARFRQEAFAAAKIRHPNLVDVTDFGIDEGRAYLVMELLEGESLSARIEREPGPMRWAEAVTIMTQVCDAVAHTHDHGLIHRDIKPGNIFLVTQPGRPGVAMAKLLDLGIAKVLRDASSMRPMAPETRLTQGTPGTPEYMSPEQALGLEIDHRIDIYAIGVTLYRMLTGFLPFQSQNSVYEVQRKHIELPPPPLFVLAPEARIPPSIQEIVLRALAKRPDERQASAWELGEELFVAHEAETGRASRSPSAREEQTMRHFRRKDEASPGGAQRLLVACMALGGLLIAGTVFMVLSLFELPFVKDMAGVREPEPSAVKDVGELGSGKYEDTGSQAIDGQPGVVDAPVEKTTVAPETPAPQPEEPQERGPEVDDRHVEARNPLTGRGRMARPRPPRMTRSSKS
ncbi:serine/threonine-protein kinase [Nannocystis pusilla]|uniref:Serine/threonine-protein kinase n=1 Tax=Nannocystis pusilla TaxID=889268 RepID=A0A9X3J1S4_9BACT|nr:serine/threonine-protein kinase [Nannocystis pusilla]MCY1013032.1 serine/threonine-protein kinase [Nannocystis pusilla]